MSVKPGDVVLYSAFGATQNALVLALRDGEVSHLGANDEPLLTLAFIKQPPPNANYKKPTSFQAAVSLPEIQIEHDVVHASHEFSDEFKQANKITTDAQVASQRGTGEWTEFEGDASELVARLRSNFTDVVVQRNDAQTEASQQRARADLAESVVESLRKELAATNASLPSDPEPPAAA